MKWLGLGTRKLRGIWELAKGAEKQAEELYAGASQAHTSSSLTTAGLQERARLLEPKYGRWAVAAAGLAGARS